MVPGKWRPAGAGCGWRRPDSTGDLHDALCPHGLSAHGDRLWSSTPRWVTDERLPADRRKEFTPTPKQMPLSGQSGCELSSAIVATQKDASGRVKAGYAEVQRGESFGGEEWAARAMSSARSIGRWRTAHSTRSTSAPTTTMGSGAGRWWRGCVEGSPTPSTNGLPIPRRGTRTPRRRVRLGSWPGWTPSAPPGTCTSSRRASGPISAATARPRSCWSRGLRVRGSPIRRRSPCSLASRGPCRPMNLIASSPAARRTPPPTS